MRVGVDAVTARSLEIRHCGRHLSFVCRWLPDLAWPTSHACGPIGVERSVRERLSMCVRAMRARDTSMY